MWTLLGPSQWPWSPCGSTVPLEGLIQISALGWRSRSAVQAVTDSSSVKRLVMEGHGHTDPPVRGCSVDLTPACLAWDLHWVHPQCQMWRH